jgi:hypothetical protein
MNNFITRIQLNGSPPKHVYDQLHGVLKSIGHTTFITDEKGVTYHLPHAVYRYVGNETRTQVCQAAYSAASLVWHDIEVLTTEGLSAWKGLKVATAAEVAAA